MNPRSDPPPGGAPAGAPVLDRAAIERLYAESLPRVAAFAARMLRDAEAGEDIAQESFAAALASASSFRGESSPLTWVLSIARKLCLKRLERMREISFADIEALIDARSEPPAPGRSEEELRFYVEEVKEGCLAGLLLCLPEAQRCVFVLHLLNGFPIRQVAEVLGRSANATRILLFRARAGMRRFLCANCSRMARGGKCSCENMVEFSLERGLIQSYRPGLEVEDIEADLREFSDEVELYRSLPDPAAAISSALESGKYRIAPKAAK